MLLIPIFDSTEFYLFYWWGNPWPIAKKKAKKKTFRPIPCHLIKIELWKWFDCVQLYEEIGHQRSNLAYFNIFRQRGALLKKNRGATVPRKSTFDSSFNALSLVCPQTWPIGQWFSLQGAQIKEKPFLRKTFSIVTIDPVHKGTTLILPAPCLSCQDAPNEL